MNNPVIRKYVSVDSSSVTVNGHTVLMNEPGMDFGDFMKQIYHFYKVSYLKFFKMDALSKLGFITAGILLNDDEPLRYEPEEKAVIIANSSSSLNTDEKHFDSIKEIPSPAIFVYTLPNIVAGEICIHHNLKGENTFFIQKKFDIQFMVNYSNILFNTTNTRKVILGWVDVDLTGKYCSLLMDVEKTEKEGAGSFTVEFINQIFKY
ncbi:MAG: 3-oxoacyl-ACP synthase [Bacteroidota bacterium]